MFKSIICSEKLSKCMPYCKSFALMLFCSHRCLFRGCFRPLSQTDGCASLHEVWRPALLPPSHPSQWRSCGKMAKKQQYSLSTKEYYDGLIGRCVVFPVSTYTNAPEVHDWHRSGNGVSQRQKLPPPGPGSTQLHVRVLNLQSPINFSQGSTKKLRY